MTPRSTPTHGSVASHLWQMDFLRELTEGETGEEP
jgi:hypothetical protein